MGGTVALRCSIPTFYDHTATDLQLKLVMIKKTSSKITNFNTTTCLCKKGAKLIIYFVVMYIKNAIYFKILFISLPLSMYVKHGNWIYITVIFFTFNVLFKLDTKHNSVIRIQICSIYLNHNVMCLTECHYMQFTSIHARLFEFESTWKTNLKSEYWFFFSFFFFRKVVYFGTKNGR